MLCFLIISIFFVNCKSGDKSVKIPEYHSDLPNFGNLQLEDVFTKQESELTDKGQILHIINDFYDKVWEGGNLSGGVLVAKGNQIIFEKYRGYGQPGETDPITKNTPMQIASVSKPITAMAILKLVEAGKLKLSDPITKFFPGFPYEGITVDMLVKQRSGLPRYEYFLPRNLFPQGHFVTNQDILKYMIEHRPGLDRKPDTGFMYCNTNFALLALIIEKVTKTPFPKAMQEMVFKALGMKHTYIFQKKDMTTATRSFYPNGGAYPWDYLDLVYGDKNVYSTPEDLFKFSKALYSNQFLTPQLKSLIFEPYSTERPGVNNYGIGFRMKIFANHTKLTYHNGWWHGSNAVFGHLLNSKVTIIAIGNKFSTKVYSTLALSGLFEDFPSERIKLDSVLGKSALGNIYEEGGE